MHHERTPLLRTQVALQVAVYRRFVLLARQRYRQQTGRLVDDQQLPVFVNDVEIDLQRAVPNTCGASGIASPSCLGSEPPKWTPAPLLITA